MGEGAVDDQVSAGDEAGLSASAVAMAPHPTDSERVASHAGLVDVFSFRER